MTIAHPWTPYTIHAKHRRVWRIHCSPSMPTVRTGADVPRRPSTVLGGSLQIPMEHALKSDLHQTPRRIFALHYSFGFSFRLPEQRTVQKKIIHTRERTPHQRASRGPCRRTPPHQRAGQPPAARAKHPSGNSENGRK